MAGDEIDDQGTIVKPRLTESLLKWFKADAKNNIPYLLDIVKNIPEETAPRKNKLCPNGLICNCVAANKEGDPAAIK
jgi:hypothetical protein